MSTHIRSSGSRRARSIPVLALRQIPLALALAASGAVHAQGAQDGVTHQLDSVVVTASGFEQQIKEAPASISVITREELETKPFHNLADAVADVEGVTVERGGKAGGMNISIRGLPSDYTLVLVDGKRLNQNSSGARPNGFGDVDTNFIPPMAAIERIEVVRGPMSTLYGSDAMGGVINIITRKVSQEWMGQITLDGTAQGDNRYGNNYGSAFYLSGPIATDKLGLTVRGGLYRRLSANGSYPVNQAEYNNGNYTGDIAGFSGLGDSLQRNLGLRLALTPNRNHDILFDIDSNWQVFDNANGELGTLNSVARNRQGGGYEPEMRFNRQRYALTHLPLRRLGQLRHQPGVRHHRDYRPDQSHERAASADRRRQARPGIRQLGLRHQVDHAVVQRAPQPHHGRPVARAEVQGHPGLGPAESEPVPVGAVRRERVAHRGRPGADPGRALRPQRAVRRQVEPARLPGLERHAGVDFQGRREQGLQDAGHQPDDRRHHRPGRAGHPAAAGQFATASRNQHLVGAGRGLRRRRRPDRQPDGVPHPLQDKLDNQNVANCRASGGPFRVAWTWACGSATACRWTISRSA